MESRDRITVYFDPEGLVTIRLPKGVMPDEKALRSVMAAINAERRLHHDPAEMGVHRRDCTADDCFVSDTIPVP